MMGMKQELVLFRASNDIDVVTCKDEGKDESEKPKVEIGKFSSRHFILSQRQKGQIKGRY